MLDLIIFTILWIVGSLLCEWLFHALVQHGVYYYTASSQALDGEQAVAFILYVLAPVIAFIVVMLIYSFVRFRSPSGALKSASQFRSNKLFIGVWLLISIGLNLQFFVHPSASALENMFNSEEDRFNRQDIEVDVVARQWQWFFSYPQYGISSAEDQNGNSTLYLPANRNIKFVLRSYDPFHTYDPYIGVIHGFWIPAFGLKQDIIPGETRYMYVHTNKITSYDVNPMMRVQCAEVCGPGHPFMEAPVHVVSNGDFQNWISQQKKMEQEGS